VLLKSHRALSHKNKGRMVAFIEGMAGSHTTARDIRVSKEGLERLRGDDKEIVDGSSVNLLRLRGHCMEKTGE